MKRTVSVLLVIAMMLLAMPVIMTSAAAPSGQAVSSAEDFANMSATGKYYLTQDITITEPYAKNFYGTFDGNGHSITINGPKYIFPLVSGTVKNLTVKGTISLTTDTEAAGVALSAGSEGMSVRFENVVSQVNITCSASTQSKPVGGIVAKMNKGNITFVNCKNEGNITSNATTTAFLGGILGVSMDGATALTFTSCTNSGKISSKKIDKDRSIGGIVGYVEAKGYGNNAFTLTFDGCKNTGALSASSDTHSGVAGMVGCIYNASSAKATTYIKNCTNSGNLTSVSPAVSLNMGGMVGRAYAMPHLYIENCINSGDLNNSQGSSWSGTGGMVGNFMTVSSSWGWSGIGSSNFTLKYCTNSGTVRGNEAGGIVGSGMQLGSENIAISLDSCVNSGSVYAHEYAGGIFGAAGLHDARDQFASLSFKSCYNAGYVKGMSLSAGILGYMAGSSTNASKKTIFDSCVNTGKVKCNYVGEWPLEIFGAGIVAKSDRAISVTGCVNTGAIQGPVGATKNTVPITPKGAVAVTASDNYCLDTYYATEAYATKMESTKAIADVITSDILAIDDSVLWNAFDEMDGLRGENYTKKSWDALVSVCNAAADILDPAKTPFNKMKQKDVNEAAENMLWAKQLLKKYVAN